MTRARAIVEEAADAAEAAPPRVWRNRLTPPESGMQVRCGRWYPYRRKDGRWWPDGPPEHDPAVVLAILAEEPGSALRRPA